MPYETATVQHETLYRHKATRTGFAGVHLRVTPIEEPILQFNSEVPRAVLPDKFVQACLSGIQEQARTGVIVGHPVRGISVTLLNAEYRSDVSTEEAFRRAGRDCFRIAFYDASPVMKDD